MKKNMRTTHAPKEYTHKISLLRHKKHTRKHFLDIDHISFEVTLVSVCSKAHYKVCSEQAPTEPPNKPNHLPTCDDYSHSAT